MNVTITSDESVCAILHSSPSTGSRILRPWPPMLWGVQCERHLQWQLLLRRERGYVATTCGLKLTCAFAPNPKTSAHRPSQDNIGAVLATPPAEWCCTAEGHCTKWASADAISLAEKNTPGCHDKGLEFCALLVFCCYGLSPSFRPLKGPPANPVFAILLNHIRWNVNTCTNFWSSLFPFVLPRWSP